MFSRLGDSNARFVRLRVIVSFAALLECAGTAQLTVE